MPFRDSLFYKTVYAIINRMPIITLTNLAEEMYEMQFANEDLFYFKLKSVCQVPDSQAISLIERQLVLFKCLGMLS